MYGLDQGVLKLAFVLASRPVGDIRAHADVAQERSLRR